MGQRVSCCARPRSRLAEFLRLVQAGDVDAVHGALAVHRDLVHRCTPYGRLSPLHIAAANGSLELVALMLERGVHPDVLNRNKQTPLMIAAMNGKIECVQKLLEAGANILMFDSSNGRTCLHHAAYYGHSDCLKAILSAAQSNPISYSWGFARFVNVRDDHGATPLHLAARQGRADCVHILLNNAAIVSSSTGSYGFPGSTALHLAARGGWIDCVRELLAWGADRLHRDSAGRIAYVIAMKRSHLTCAALLNPSSAEPLVWPSPLKFISELNEDAKLLLEAALMAANLERERKIFEGAHLVSRDGVDDVDCGDDTDSIEEDGSELCCICFERPCTIEVRECAHQMCAPCTLSLCCHSKPNPSTLSLSSPTCPFCRSAISKLVVAKKPESQIPEPQIPDSQIPETQIPESQISESKIPESKAGFEESERVNSVSVRRVKSRSRNLSNEGASSGSFKGISMGLGFMGRGSGRIADVADKLDHVVMREMVV